MSIKSSKEVIQKSTKLTGYLATLSPEQQEKALALLGTSSQVEKRTPRESMFYFNIILPGQEIKIN